MRHEDYQKHVIAFTEEMRSVTAAKNIDYSAGSNDAMQNYYELSNASGVTPFQTWMVLMMKHVTAIMRYAKTGSVVSESIHGRMVDLANYALLGDALINDLVDKNGGLPEVTGCVLCGDRGTLVSFDSTRQRVRVDCPACNLPTKEFGYEGEEK